MIRARAVLTDTLDAMTTAKGIRLDGRGWTRKRRRSVRARSVNG